MNVEEETVSFLKATLPLLTQDVSEYSDIFVTVTFAQSLDAKIAGKGGCQLTLSGEQSMRMTHYLRSMHDAILVGIGTALNDDPQLNTRLLPIGTANPIPIIMDSDLRFRADAKLLVNYRSLKGKQPLIITKARANDDNDLEYRDRWSQLEAGGAKICHIPEKDGLLSLPALLEVLRGIEIRSLMVEGGAKIISSFLQSGLVNSTVITVAPKFIGDDGFGYDMGHEGISKMTHVGTQLIGVDVVTVFNVLKVNSGSTGTCESKS